MTEERQKLIEKAKEESREIAQLEKEINEIEEEEAILGKERRGLLRRLLKLEESHRKTKLLVQAVCGNKMTSVAAEVNGGAAARKD